MSETEVRPTLSAEILPVDRIRVLIPHNPEVAHYNAAVLRSKKNPNYILILLREVQLASVRAGIPDRGNLMLYLSTPEKVVPLAPLDLLHPEIDNWEDARGFMSEDVSIDKEMVEFSEVSIGLTAIMKGNNQPVAATVKGRMIDNDFSLDVKTLKVYPKDRGKNVTPIELDKYLFRREGAKHQLELVEESVDEEGQNKLIVKKIIDFPKKAWCEWQIGTQAQLLPGGILPIHGVNRFSLGIDPMTNREVFGFTYSLGMAQLDADLNVVKVTEAPLYTRESFKNILPMGREMDPNKDVVYCCGYSVEGDQVRFVINVGDLMTIEVVKSLTELKSLLDQTEMIENERPYPMAA